MRSGRDRPGLSVLVADDEPLVRTGLRALLADDARIGTIHEARNGEEAIAVVRAERPAIALLDIRMPGCDGFAVVDALEPTERPAVIFVTAFDQYAVRAFDHAAVDYVLKPVDPDRLQRALNRTLGQVAAQGSPGLDDETLEDLARAVRRIGSEVSPYMERLLVRTRIDVQVVPVDDVDWFEADRNYVHLNLRTRGASPLPPLRTTMSELAAVLDPGRFARANRSAIVRLAAVRSLEPTRAGDLTVVLDHGRRVSLGRTFRLRFEARLCGRSPGERGLDIGAADGAPRR